jgi:hypothetical protein
MSISPAVKPSSPLDLPYSCAPVTRSDSIAAPESGSNRCVRLKGCATAANEGDGSKIAIITALSAVAAAIIAGGFGLASVYAGKDDSASTSSSGSECPKKLSLKSPASGAQVSGKKGVIIKGVACSLDKDTGWIFELDTTDHYYYEAYDDDPGPLILNDGGWVYPDSPIGDKGDRKKRITITLVLASPSCQSALLDQKPSNGAYKFREFPKACRVVDSVDVFVTWK